jgi:hypothetical protein
MVSPSSSSRWVVVAVLAVEDDITEPGPPEPERGREGNRSLLVTLAPVWAFGDAIDSLVPPLWMSSVTVSVNGCWWSCSWRAMAGLAAGPVSVVDNLGPHIGGSLCPSAWHSSSVPIQYRTVHGVAARELGPVDKKVEMGFSLVVGGGMYLLYSRDGIPKSDNQTSTPMLVTDISNDSQASMRPAAKCYT